MGDNINNTIFTALIETPSRRGILVKRGLPIAGREGISLLGGHIEISHSLEESLLRSAYTVHRAPLFHLAGLLGVYQYNVGETWITNIVSVGQAAPYTELSSERQPVEPLKGHNDLYSASLDTVMEQPSRTPEFHTVMRDYFEYREGRKQLADIGIVHINTTSSLIVQSTEANPTEATVAALVIQYQDRFILAEGERLAWKGLFSLLGGKVEGDHVFEAASREGAEEGGEIWNPTMCVGITVNRFGNKTYTIFGLAVPKLKDDAYHRLMARPPNDEIARIVALTYDEIKQYERAGKLRTPDIPQMVDAHLRMDRNPSTELSFTIIPK